MFRLKIEEVQRFMAVFKGKKFLKHGYVTIVEKLKRCCWVVEKLKTSAVWYMTLDFLSYGLGSILGTIKR